MIHQADSPLQVSLQTCKKCNTSINEGHAYELGDDRWHINCFKCSKCESSLGCNSNFLVLGNGSLICSNCSYNCKQCGKKIDDLAILTGDQAYCSSCFKCRSCKLKIEDLRYARTSKGLFCMSCHEKLIAKKKKADLKKKQLALEQQQQQQQNDPNQINLNNLENNNRHLQDISNQATPKLSDPSSKRNSMNTNTHELFLNPNRSSSSMVTKDKTLPPPPLSTGIQTSTLKHSQTDNSLSIADIDNKTATIEQENDPVLLPIRMKSDNAPLENDNDFSIEEINDSDDELNKIKAHQKPVQHQIELDIHEDEQPLSRDSGLILDIIESASDPTTPKDLASGSSLDPPADITPNRNDDITPIQKTSETFKNKNLLILSPGQYHDNEFHHTNNTFQSPISSPNKKSSNLSVVNDAKPRSNGASPLARANRQARVVETYDDLSNQSANDSYNSDLAATPNKSKFNVASSPPPRGAVPSTPVKTPTSGFLNINVEPRGLGLEGIDYHNQRSEHIFGNTTPSITNLEDTIRDDDEDHVDHQRLVNQPQASPQGRPPAQSLTQSQTITRKNTLIRTPKLSLKHKRSISGGSTSGGGLSSKFGFFKSRDENAGSPNKENVINNRHSRHVSEGSISNASAFTTPPLPLSSPITQYGFNREHVRSTSDTLYAESDLTDSAAQQSELYKHELDLRQMKSDIYHFEVQRQSLYNDVKKLNNDKLKLNDHLKQIQTKLANENLRYEELSKEINSLENKRKKLLEINQSLSEENHQLETSIKNRSTFTPSNAFHGKSLSQDMNFDNKTSSTGGTTNLTPSSGTNYTNLTSNSSSSLIGTSYPEALVNSGEDAGGVETHKATRLKFWRRPKISLNSVNGNGEPKSTNDFGSNIQATTSIGNGNGPGNGNGVGNGNGTSNLGIPYSGHIIQNGSSMTSSESVSGESGGKKGLGSFITKSRSTNILDSFIGGPTNNLEEHALFSTTIQKRADFEKLRVPLIISKCIEEVEKRGLDIEGIYRLSGGNSAIQSVENAFNNLIVTNEGVDEKTDKLNELSNVDINAVTSALKRYLRKIPDPLIPFSLYDEYIKVISQNPASKADKKINDLKTNVIQRLAPANKATLYMLCKHLALVNSYQSVNRMGYKNLSVVFAPTVARDVTGEKEMTDMGYRNEVTEFLLNNYEKIFETI